MILLLAGKHGALLVGKEPQSEEGKASPACYLRRSDADQSEWV